MNEIWRPVIGHEDGYEVSSLGRVRSLARKCASKSGERSVPTRLLKPDYRRGYPSVTLYKNGKKTRETTAHLVAQAFIGPKPEDAEELCHNDGNRGNSSVGNLRWDTRIGNHSDKWKHGTYDVKKKFLTEIDVRAIKALAIVKSGLWLAETFGESQGTISHILVGRNWKHVHV